MKQGTTLELNSAEIRRQAMQAAIDARKSAAERNRLGQFATPNALAIEIARHVFSLLDESQRRSIEFADPSIGSGSFFSAASAVFGAGHIQRAIGVELDPAFVNAARELWADSVLEVIEGDFTRILASEDRPEGPTLVLANPPYVRHHHLGRDDKLRLHNLVRELTGVKVSGLAGLYVYFMLLATAWMKLDGVAAWLIPSEFMDVNYGSALKAFLGQNVTLLRIHRFDPGDVQFGDALVTSAVVVFRKKPPAPDHAVEFTYGGTLQEPHARELVPLVGLTCTAKWSVHPAHEKNNRHSPITSGGPTLGDFFRIQRGIATGCNKLFVLERAEALRMGLPPQFLRPVLPSPRHLKDTVVESTDDGYPRIDHPLCVIDCALPEPVLKTSFPRLWAYLQNAQAQGLTEGYLLRKRSPWYKQEQRAPALFLSTYMGRGTDEKTPFRFILNRSQAIGTNLYLMLYPRRGLDIMLREHPGRTDTVHALLGQITGHQLRGAGRVYGGGLNKIEPRELAMVSAQALVDLWPELEFRTETQESLFA